MKNYQIISDGSCDLSPELVAQHQLKIVPFYVSFDGETYLKECEELQIRSFYQEMVDHPKVFPKSSLPSVQDYIDAFTPYVTEGTPVLCICITSKFSGSYNSARTARDILLETYPDAQIFVLDSMVNTCLQGLVVLEAARMRDSGVTIQDNYNTLEQLKGSGRIFFTIGSIDYLKNGGRIGRLAGIAVATLGIKPLIQLKEGEIFSCGISRNRKKSMEKVIAEIRSYFEKSSESPDDYRFTVGYGYSQEEALSFRKLFLASLAEYSHITDVPLAQIGATIAVHTGPEPIGVGLIRRYDAVAPQAAVVENTSFLRTAHNFAMQTAHAIASQTKQTAQALSSHAKQNTQTLTEQAKQPVQPVAEQTSQPLDSSKQPTKQ